MLLAAPAMPGSVDLLGSPDPPILQAGHAPPHPTKTHHVQCTHPPWASHHIFNLTWNTAHGVRGGQRGRQCWHAPNKPVCSHLFSATTASTKVAVPLEPRACSPRRTKHISALRTRVSHSQSLGPMHSRISVSGQPRGSARSPARVGRPATRHGTSCMAGAGSIGPTLTPTLLAPSWTVLAVSRCQQPTYQNSVPKPGFSSSSRRHRPSLGQAEFGGRRRVRGAGAKARERGRGGSERMEENTEGA